jgi:hypothetical protein
MGPGATMPGIDGCPGPGGRAIGGRRTTGLLSPDTNVCLDSTDPAGECILSRREDRRLIDKLGEWAEPAYMLGLRPL